MKKILLLFSLAILVFQHHDSYGQKLPFQGRLLENGTPVNTALPIEFSIPDVSWSETHSSVNVENGLYSVVLGSITPLPANLFDGVDERSLNITVNGTALSAVKIYPALTKPLSVGTTPGLVFSDSISIVDNSGRKSLVLKSHEGELPTSTVKGFGSNGKANFSLSGRGEGHNYGILGLYDAQGENKAWMGVNQKGAGSPESSGIVSLYGPTGGWVGLGFKTWENTGNMPYISLEGTTPHESRVWIDIFKDPETGVEMGTINLTSSDGKSLHLDANTQLGIPRMGPTTENFHMEGKHWEEKGDYPLFHMKGTIKAADGYTMPLVDLNTYDDGISEWGYFSLNAGKIGGSTVDSRVILNVGKDGDGNEIGSITLSSASGKSLYIDANTPIGVPYMGPTTENFQMGGKDWEGKGDYPVFELKGTIKAPEGYIHALGYIVTNDDGTNEWANMGINAGVIGGSTVQNMVDLHVRNSTFGISGGAIFRGPNSDNIIIGSQDWEEGGSDRGDISILGNSLRTDENGNSYNPALFRMHVLKTETDEVGAFRMENGAGNVNVDLNATGPGYMIVRDGTGEVSISGNGDINASGYVTAMNVTAQSDRRYKENIVGLENPLQNTLKLRGVSYFWKDKAKSERRQIGLIAQEVEEVYPEFVHTDEKGYKSVNYSAMVAVLIEAVKELENKVEALEKENSTLVSENASLKANLETEMDAIHQRMNQLETLLNLQSQKASAEQVAIDGSGK